MSSANSKTDLKRDIKRALNKNRDASNARNEIFLKPRKSLILDPIHPRDYRELTIIHCCEQCSHFCSDTKTCTIGYEAGPHLKQIQEDRYHLLGRVAFCRFCEID